MEFSYFCTKHANQTISHQTHPQTHSLSIMKTGRIASRSLLHEHCFLNSGYSRRKKLRVGPPPHQF